MNAKLAISLAVIAGVAFAGCGLQPSTTNPEPSANTTVEESAKPTLMPSAEPLNKDESEVKGIENEFNNIDASKDFPDFTQTDLQQ